MDRVPISFCERVLDLQKCCYKPCMSCNCNIPQFADRKWNATRKSNVELIIENYTGDWMYSFRLQLTRQPLYLSLQQMMAHTELKNLRISEIQIDHDSTEAHLELDMAVLRFATYLCNEPLLSLHSSPQSIVFEGMELLSWLQQRTFSEITIHKYHSIYNRLLERQFARHKPTRVVILEVKEDEDFLADRLRSGDLRLLQSNNRFKFPSNVVEAIIERYLHNPADYNKDNLNIVASFRENAKMKLMGMAKRRLCKLETFKIPEANWNTLPYRHVRYEMVNSTLRKVSNDPDLEYSKFVFDNQTPVLVVKESPCSESLSQYIIEVI